VTLPTASGDLGAFVKGQLIPSIRNVSGSGATADPADQRNEYILPTAGQLATWRTVFQRLCNGDYSGAHTQARTVSATYNVVQYDDTASGRRYYVLMEGTPGQIPAAASHSTGVNITDPADPRRRGWGTYIFNPNPRRLISLTAPHVKDDLETGDQAIEAFVGAGAHSLLMAGADRDQNTALAACDQSSRPYLEADMAHNAESVFQIAFEELYACNSNLHHLQLHGNAACNEDVFLSNGQPAPPVILQTLAANIFAASQAAAAGGPTLTVDVYDSPADCSLRATQNSQLRFAAGVPHAQVCATGMNPPGPSRVIHFEQLRIARRSALDPQATPGQNRDVIRMAIDQTFP
jgi:hypothetical protein